MTAVLFTEGQTSLEGNAALAVHAMYANNVLLLDHAKAMHSPEQRLAHFCRLQSPPAVHMAAHMARTKPPHRDNGRTFREVNRMSDTVTLHTHTHTHTHTHIYIYIYMHCACTPFAHRCVSANAHDRRRVRTMRVSMKANVKQPKYMLSCARNTVNAAVVNYGCTQRHSGCVLFLFAKGTAVNKR